MIWNIIYEFFIINVFGGYYDGNFYDAFFGLIDIYDSGSSIGTNDSYNWDYMININGVVSGYDNTYSLYMPLGNYLSLIATIISIVIILVLCCLFIKKIITTFVRVAL